MSDVKSARQDWDSPDGELMSETFSDDSFGGPPEVTLDDVNGATTGGWPTSLLTTASRYDAGDDFVIATDGSYAHTHQ